MNRAYNQSRQANSSTSTSSSAASSGGGSFWSRITGATAAAYEGLANVYMARTMADMFPEGMSTSTRPTNLDTAVTEARPSAAAGQVISGVNNSTLILGGVGVVALLVLAMRK